MSQDPNRPLPERPGQEDQGGVTEWAAWWSAPLPPPQQLAQYDTVLPGLAERIVSLMEREAGHRHWLDRSFVRYRFFGQTGSFLLALAIVGAGTYLVNAGDNVEGFATIIAAVAGLITVFLVRQFFGNGGDSD